MFREWPADRFTRHIEGRGYRLRQRLRLNDCDALDPWRLIATYDNIRILDLSKIDCNVTGLEILRKARWSAIAYRENGGPWLVAWNPWHANTRTKVSVMEEVAHIMLGHAPTKMVPDPVLGLPRRTFSPSKEKEAYGVAAAALVPYNGMFDMLRGGCGCGDVAARYGVSEELARMRLRVTGVEAQVRAPCLSPITGASGNRTKGFRGT
jgi:hypothetical protein